MLTLSLPEEILHLKMSDVVNSLKAEIDENKNSNEIEIKRNCNYT
jgi:hypothetical protein